MTCRSDLSGSGEPRRQAADAADDGSSGEPSKKQRTERPPSSSEAGECSSSRAPPQTQQQEQEQPPPDADAGGSEQSRVPDLGEDLIFEVLRRAEARTLAAASGVSRAWRQLAQDERLWEAACVREWANLGYSEWMLRNLVLSLGGFRVLHELHIRPLQRRSAGAPRQGRRQVPVRLGRDQVQVSLSLFSTSFFQNMPNAPPAPKKDKDNDRDKSGGGQCG